MRLTTTGLLVANTMLTMLIAITTALLRRRRGFPSTPTQIPNIRLHISELEYQSRPHANTSQHSATPQRNPSTGTVSGSHHPAKYPVSETQPRKAYDQGKTQVHCAYDVR